MEPLRQRINNKLVAVDPVTYLKLLDIQSKKTSVTYRPTLKEVIDDLVEFYMGGNEND